MALSQNGWVAKNYQLMNTVVVPTANVRVTVRKGDVTTVLLWLLEQYHKRVEPLRQKDTGGYNPRSIVGNHTLSNHASGTAVDTNWNDHVLGKSGTFTNKQEQEIDEILNYLEGVVRWGGNYSGRKDEMHFEIVGSPTAVARVARKIKSGVPAKVASKPKNDNTLEKGDEGPRVKKLQEGLNKVFPAYSKLKVDSDFGPATEKVVKEFQRRSKLDDDGIVGSKTIAELKKHGINI